jgi:hypothetical protein
MRAWVLLVVGVMLSGCGSERDASGVPGSNGRGPVGKADLPGSCRSTVGDSCGKQSKSGSCWCDATCVEYGDCCSDAKSVCGFGSSAGHFDYDLLSTSLDVDLEARSARARIRFDAASASGISLESQGLQIDAVSDASGPLAFETVDGRIDVSVPPTAASAEIVVDYHFAQKSSFDGLLAGGSTFVWPYFCGNLFPCKSDPADGLSFQLDVHGAPSGESVVFPKSVDADAPSYMLAWATGAYSYRNLGTTAAGTQVGVYSLPGDEAGLDAAVAPLTAGFDWYEKTLGPYSFGHEVASVSVNWGPGAYGGMEHHPYWHVGRDSMGDKTTHLHEAAHGWFGDGVRLACWEDFVLSEGTVSYLTARAEGAAEGAAAEQEVWSDYETRLQQAVAQRDHVAWPDSCGQVDVLKDLFTSVPYMKGAFFYRAVAQKVGAAKLDQVIGKFYVAHVGKAARMQDMLDAIQSETGFDPTALADAWLRTKGIPN